VTNGRSKSKQSPHAHSSSGSSALGDRANLGPKSIEFLRSAGITEFEQLQRLGSVRAYSMVKQVEPTATLNLPWGLEAAISDLHRREVAKEHRTSLLLALETHEQGRRK
jgi:DNA transformation protein